MKESNIEKSVYLPPKFLVLELLMDCVIAASGNLGDFIEDEYVGEWV